MSERITFTAYLEDHLSPGFEKIEREGKEAFNKVDREQREMMRNTKRAGASANQLSGTFKRLGGIVAGAAVGYKLMQWGGAIVETTAKFERFEAVLTNTLGSRGAARDSFEMIKEFGATTPFQVDELTDSFVKLTNQGFKPSQAEMGSLGDLAASTGKSFDQLSEAIIDAQVGEFERLKEFGIRASKQGDKVTMTFKGQKKQMDFTEESIRKYILSLGKAEGVSGAMSKISKTTGGQISNLRDNVDSLNYSLGKRFKPITEAALRTAGDMVSTFNDWVEVPLSEELEKERIEANLLVSQITDLNTTEDDRRTILNKLREINPDIVDGINAEKVNMGQLTTQLRKYNDEAIKSIILEKRKEALRKKREEATQAGTKAQEELLKVQERGFAIIEKVKSRDKGQGQFLEDVFYGRFKSQESRDKLRDNNYDQWLALNQAGFDVAQTPKQMALSELNVIGQTAKQFGLYEDVVNMYGGDIHKYLKYSAKRKNLMRESMSMEKQLDRMRKKFGLSGGDGGDVDTDPPTGTLDGDIEDKILTGVHGDRRKVTNLTIQIDKQLAIEQIAMTDENQQETLDEFTDKLKTVLQNVVSDAVEIAN